MAGGTCSSAATGTSVSAARMMLQLRNRVASRTKVRLDTERYRFQFVEPAERSPTGGCGNNLDTLEFDDFMIELWTAVHFIQDKKKGAVAPFLFASDKPGSVGYFLP